MSYNVEMRHMGGMFVSSVVWKLIGTVNVSAIAWRGGGGGGRGFFF